MMQDYELMVILKPDLEDEKLKETLDKIRAAIKKEEGGVETFDIWGIRELAYKIGRYAQGHYSVVLMKIPPQAIKSLQSKLKLMDEVIRFMITKT